ncbi:MAG: glycogen/starch/alpha-glucan phosphorylase [Campylobacterales bacterium]
MQTQSKHPIPNSQHQLLKDIQRHVVNTLGNDYRFPRKATFYNGLAYAVRDRLVQRWVEAQRNYYDQETKRVYYLSMEFLPGRFLMNYITNMQMEDEVRHAVEGFDFTLEELEEQEWDAGLGNGGLGRLASCYMDSLATLKIPSYGYGLRYDYGIFYQKIINGYQVEESDNWIRHGNPWEFARRGFLYDVQFYGKSESYRDIDGLVRHRWVDAEVVKAMACDILIPGYGNDNVNHMRLWEAVSSEQFDLSDFNKGDYTGAMEAKVLSETLSKVLYPSDERDEGKELRLKQQYFLVAATFQDIMRRFKKRSNNFKELPEKIAVQLNDTHPTIAIPELMRLLVDEEGLAWEDAWDISTDVFAYTNHTLLPEALETWSVERLSRVLPRHMEIIYEINFRFLEFVKKQYPDRPELLEELSIIKEGAQKRVRMAHIAIIGSHKVNGVAELHSRLLKESLFPEFNKLYPGKFINVTNGVTPRRWVLQSNPELSNLITSKIGDNWITHLDELKKLIPLTQDAEFVQAWKDVKTENKMRLIKYIYRKTGIAVDASTIFDVHIKRIHEYKRQLLNVLHAIALYVRIKKDPTIDIAPRTKIFAGKAAPAYHMAKRIIKLINSVASVVNNDPEVSGKLKVVFMPNYCITAAEHIIPASDLSEQISTAGMEASGTGNMKFALNGALTIGTLDGANVEMKEEIGDENIFIFGLKADEVAQKRKEGYDPYEVVQQDRELKEVLRLINDDHFCPDEPGLFKPIIKSLLEDGDWFLTLADFRSYVDTQDEIEKLYKDQDKWLEKSILNTANMGKFSSDRSIKEYAKNIWKTKPLD